MKGRNAISAFAFTLLLTVPAGMPLDGGSSPEVPAPAPAGGQRTLLDLAAALAGVAPDSPQGRALEAQMATLETLPPAYETATRVTLESMVAAKQLQDHALRNLSPAERRTVLEAEPDAPPTPGLRAALAKVDMAAVAAALAALADGSSELQRIIDASRREGTPTPGGVERALRDRFDLGAPPGAPVPRAVSPDSVASLLGAAAGMDPRQTAALASDLEGLPYPVVEALAVLAEGLAPLAAGAGADTPDRIGRLAAAVDAARPALETWSALALAAQLHGASAPPLPALPDPDTEAPPLRWGMASWTEGPLPPLEADAEATGRALATLFLADSAAAAQAGRDLERVLSGLPPAQADAILRVLDALRDHIGHAAAAHRTEPPAGVDAQDLARWASMADQGRMPEPGSADARHLLEAVPYMQAQRRAVAAAQRLHQALEELVPSFASASGAPGPDDPGTVPGTAQPASNHEGTPGCREDEQVLFILAIDTCGGDSSWSQDVMLRVDVGGDDRYTARLGAPFVYQTGLPPASGLTQVGIPVALTVDLGGNDTYVTGRDCAQGAACPDHPAAALDPTGVSGLAPLGVLVDWDGDGVQARNTFHAGNRSQGFYASTASALQNAAGILVERVGANASLSSHYEAGDRSQGSAVSRAASATSDARGGRGLLVRLVGAGSVSDATFEAGADSQASSSTGLTGGVSGTFGTAAPPAYSLAALLNVAGPEATSHDTYRAGPHSQGAIHTPNNPAAGSANVGAGNADAVFADVVGPGGRSHDVYDLTQGPGRGHLDDLFASMPNVNLHRPMRALFLDAALPRPAQLDQSPVQPDTSGDLAAVGVSPSLRGARTSNDTYRGDIPPGGGYGWTSHLSSLATPTLAGGFYDVGGDDTYELHPAWGQLPVDQRPRDDGAWGRNATPTGIDVDLHDDDRDGHPAAVEQLWPFWTSDPEDGGTSPAPLRSYISLDRQRDVVLDGPHGLVLLAGGDDVLLGDYSAAVHVDLAGDDIHMGRAGAAVGAGPATVADGDPAVAQHGLSFHLDVGGDDRYESALPRNHGFAEAGAVGLLIDLDGSDRYVAPEQAQGVALQGTGLGINAGGSEVDTAEAAAAAGVLVDVGSASDWNWFQAGPQSQGHSDGPPRLAALVATGGHNTFPDGVDEEPDDGASLNLGSNVPPEVEFLGIRAAGQQDPAPTPLLPEQEYVFSARVRDPDGDPVHVCWRFEHGGPVSQHGGRAVNETCAWHGQGRHDGWRQVEQSFTWGRDHPIHTDATVVGNETDVTYTVQVNATDSGGASADPAMEDVDIANAPPRLIGGLEGDADPPLGALEAYQVPFAIEDDTLEPTFVVDWGDGSRTVTTGDTIDWARASRGATTRLPDAVPIVAGDRQGDLSTVQNLGSSHPLAIDGDPLTTAAFQFDPLDFPLVHLLVEFPTLRQVGNITLEAHATVPFELSVEGINPAGRPVPLGTVRVDPQGADRSVVLPERPLLGGLVLRQVAPPDRSDPPAGFLNIQEVLAMGPGAEHEWRRTGDFEIAFAVIDELGGRNATGLNVTVRAPTGGQGQTFDETRGDILDVPLRLLDVADRGPVRHASVGAHPASAGNASAQDRPLRLRSLTDEGTADPCLTDAGGARQGGVCAAVDWGDGSPVERVSVPAAGQTLELFHRWAEVGDHTITIIYESATGSVGPSAVATVHVEQALDIRLGTGGEANPLLFITLDDRTTWHTGTAYHAIVDAAGDDRYFDAVAVPRGGVPSMVVDAAGDDDYLSLVPRTQGFGALAAAALLVDAAGHDRYVAPGMAQGAADTLGAGMLVDAGGNDAWNPVPHDHPAVLAGRPDRFEPWADSGGTRPTVLNATRPSMVRSESPLVQGASEDGLGVLVAQGGMDIFVAGDRSQGYGGHDPRVHNALDYVLANPGCLPNPTNPPSTLNQLLCATGVAVGGTGPGCPPQVGCPVITPLVQFLEDGPRYGPGLGLLLRPDGPAGLRAGSDAQAASTESGRGLLLDLDGASVMTASRRGQAYSVNGTSVLAVGGTHSTWLGDEGQFMAREGNRAPEGTTVPPPPVLAYLGGPRDARCEGPSCSLGSPAPTAVDDGADPTPRPPAPALAWGDATQVDFASGLPTHRADALHLEVDVGADAASQSAVETVVLSTVHPSSDAGACRGEPLAGPVALHPLTRHPAGTSSVGVDVDLASQSPDGRVVPAGCHRIHAFARQVDAAGHPISEWASLAGEVRLLATPPVRLTGETGQAGAPVLESSGAPVDFTVFVPEPLAGAGAAATASPVLELDITDAGGQPTGGWSVDMQPWQPGVEGDQVGAHRILTLQPPGPGSYLIQASTAWSTAPAQPVGTLAALAVDTEPPQAALDPAAPTVWWGGGQTVLTGTVSDAGTGVDRLELRLVRNEPSCLDDPAACLVDVFIPSLAVDPQCMAADGRPHHCALEAVPSFPTGQHPAIPCPADSCATVPDPLPTQPVEGTVQLATLEPTGTPGEWRWWASMRTTSNFRGGEVVLQARTRDDGGTASAWSGLSAQGMVGPTDGQILLVDKSPPEPLHIRAEGGAAGTNRTHPIPLEAGLRDCAADPAVIPECVPGSGVSADGVSAFVRDLGRNTLQPLVTQGVSADGDHSVAALVWEAPGQGSEPGQQPAQGSYEVILQSRDEAGNILSLNPGVVLHVDREPPSFVPGSEAFSLPEGQEAVKPGDTVSISARVLDLGAAPTWIEQVAARIGGSEANLTPDGDGYVGNVTVPSTTMDTVRVTVEASDAARNRARIQSDPIPFFRQAPEVVDLDTRLRSESIDLRWNTSRPVQVTQASLLRQGGGQVQGAVETDGVHHRVRFQGLDPETVYAPQLAMRDVAAFEVVLSHLGPWTTLPKADAQISLVPPPEATYAGVVDLTAAIQDAVVGSVTLYADNASTPHLARVSIEPAAPGEQDLSVPLTFDSRNIADTLEAAREVPLVAVMDDGESLWNDSIVLRIDNAPPQLSPFVDGPDPHLDQWFNATVVVHAGASDDTPPLSHETVLGPGPGVASDRLQVAQEGEHIIRFTVYDGAVPPNAGTAERRLVIDASEPELEAEAASGAPAVRDRVVPLAISALDPGAEDRLVAGMAGVRVRLDGGAWTAWAQEPPASVEIPPGPDGHHWIHVEARDAVHNTARSSIPVLLDRTPPDILVHSWAGTADGAHVLEFVAHDRLNGTGRPSGVVAVRHGPQTASGVDGPWSATDGVGTLRILPHEVEQAVWIEVVDAAGNSASARLESPAGDPDAPTADEPTPAGEARHGASLREGRVVPGAGSASQPFTFSVLASPRNGTPPDAVWLEVADLRVRMRPDPQPLEDGTRIYTATVALPASRLDDPHNYRFEAHYGDQVFASAPAPGPLVSHLDQEQALDAGARDSDRGIAAPAVPLAALALAALARTHARRKDP